MIEGITEKCPSLNVEKASVKEKGGGEVMLI